MHPYLLFISAFLLSAQYSPQEDCIFRGSEGYHKYTIVNEVHDGIKSDLLHCNNPGLKVFEVSRNLSSQNEQGAKLLYRVCLDTRSMRTKFAVRVASSEIWHLTYSPRENSEWGFAGLGEEYQARTLCNGYFRQQQKQITSRAYDVREFEYYFNRGHLVGFADFPVHEDKKTTYLYLNVAPQWDSLNAGSWEKIEREVRSQLSYMPENWEVYTGTYGIIHANGHPLYLAPNNQLPVPKVFWKILYNLKDRTSSRVFIGVNDPTIKSRFAMDITHTLCVNPKHRSDGYGGFTHECPLDEFLTNLKKEENIVNKKGWFSPRPSYRS